MYISRIVYIQEKQLDRLKDALNELDFYFVEKVESETNPEVWVGYSDMLVENLFKAGFLSAQDKLSLNKAEESIGVTEILFYA